MSVWKKIPLGTAQVYLHLPQREQGVFNFHLDVESPVIAELMMGLPPTVCGGKPCGCFIGLRKAMIERARALFKKEIREMEEKHIPTKPRGGKE